MNRQEELGWKDLTEEEMEDGWDIPIGSHNLPELPKEVNLDLSAAIAILTKD